MTTTAATDTATIIGKCPTCKTLTSVTREWRHGIVKAGPRAGTPCRDLIGGYAIDCKDCGQWIRNAKTATLSDVKCGPKCTNATGPACSCECGGRNHGAH